MSRMLANIFKLAGVGGVLILLPISLILSQTTGKISGTVTDAETGEPLPGVNIVLEGTDQGAATDETGHYFIVNVDPGRYSLTASMIGYQRVTKTDVLVSVNHTTPVNFSLRTEAIAGEAVTVEAEREIIKMDESASTVSVTSEEIEEVATVTTVEEYLNTRAGVEGMSVRGGSVDETQFLIDGLTVVDNRRNQPVVMVNLSAVQELNIVKGGFNAEYGNVRSGLINVITKEGNPNRYSASVDFRYSPPHLKHGGVPITDHRNWFVRSFLDPDVAFVGTDAWPEDMQKTYPTFKGWDKVAEELNSNESTIDDRTAEESRDLFIWRQGLEGAEELGGQELKYAHKPDWKVDGSFGGPVPIVGQSLGDLSFFLSHRSDWQLYALPVSPGREYYKEKNTSLKLTSRLSSALKVTLEGAYGEVNALERARGGAKSIIYGKRLETPGTNTDMYVPAANPPVDTYRSLAGISMEHVLSANTFYNLDIAYLQVNDVCHGWHHLRDTTTVRYFGNTPVDEAPYGYWWQELPRGWPMLFPLHIPELELDNSNVNTLNLRFDLTSQVNRNNQLKIGWTVNYDAITEKVNQVKPGHGFIGDYGKDWVTGVPLREWHQEPYRIGAYIQNKLEFEGMIANFGIRLDYSNPNSEWFEVGTYSKYFSGAYHDTFKEEAPKEPTEDRLKISPRLGISHPISENAKMYFNYGHFYSMPGSGEMYRIRYRPPRPDEISHLGNPNLDLPRTVAYELGFDFNVGQMFKVQLAGYYKDIGDQIGPVGYTNFGGSVDYTTYNNSNYQDTRGAEIRIEKRYGQWVRGWINYDYRVTTSGYVGRRQYYEDPRRQRLYGLHNPYQERPLARPIARAFIQIGAPVEWGPRLGGIPVLGDLNLSWLFYYRSGEYETWDPLETYELKDNIHWRGEYNVDAKLTKRFRIGQYVFSIFADVRNIFNIKTIDQLGFSDSDDKRDYLESLHLPMYDGPEYEERGLVAGNDRPGDMKSEDKPYINMPDREFLTYLNPRTAFFGFRFQF